MVLSRAAVTHAPAARGPRPAARAPAAGVRAPAAVAWNVYVGTKTASGVRTPHDHLAPTYTFRRWPAGALVGCPTARGTQVLRSWLRLAERVTPNGAGLVPFAVKSHRYASQTRSVRRNSLPYDTGGAGTNLNNKQRTTHRLEIVWQPAPNAKCMRGDDGCGWGRDPRGTFRPHVYISVGGRLGRWLGAGPVGGRAVV